MTDPTEYYFAFGANMARRVLVSRRGIVPIASEPAVLLDHALRFTQRGLPFVEPAFADLWRAPGERMHGVLHLLRRSDLRRLDRLEASYDRVDVVVQTARGPVAASAYTSRHRVRERLPSSRYLGLLLEGAREHGLPDDFIRTLEARPARHLPVVSSLAERVASGVDRLLRTRKGSP